MATTTPKYTYRVQALTDVGNDQVMVNFVSAQQPAVPGQPYPQPGQPGISITVPKADASAQYFYPGNSFDVTFTATTPAA